MSKPRIRVYSTGMELDAGIRETMRRSPCGSGMAMGDCARDQDFEYETEAERESEFARVSQVLRQIPGVRLERR